MRELALEMYLSRWRSASRHHLSASESETMPLPELLGMADDEDRGRWQMLQLGYGDSRGASWLRQTIAGAYQSVTEDAVLCFAGAQEGIHATMLALLAPDDHAIVVTPNYQSIETIAASLCSVTGIALDGTRKWTLDLSALAAAIRPNTKLICINFPNNPTGKILERDALQQLVALCRRHGLWLLSDEIYRLIERDETMRLPAIVDVYERGISIGCMSKSYGLPGLRVGWAACQNRDIVTAVLKAKHYMSNCLAAPSEVLANIALKAGEMILSRNRAIAENNLARLNAFFAIHDDLFAWQEPDGGVVGYPRYNGSEGVDAFCTRLIAERGILLLPASVYRSDSSHLPDKHFRIGFGQRDFTAGLEALEDGLPKRSFRRRGAV